MKKILFLTAAVFFPGMCFASQEEYEALSPEERETGLKTMIEAALEIAR